MKAHLPVAGALGLILALSSTPAVAEKKSLFDAKTIQRINRAVQTIGGVKQAFGQEQPKTPLERQRWAYGVVAQPGLDAALDQVLQELRRVAGPEAPRARIHVTPDPSFQAYATEDGSIFVSAGMLQSLESRDELAALLGHEYAHVLRGHTGRTALETTRGVLSGLSAMYLDSEFGDNAAAARRPETRYVRQALLRETAMQSVQSGIVPSRARKQEDEADRVGTDLMVAAGYNPVGMIDLLDRIDQWEKISAEAAVAQPQQRSAVAGTVARYAGNSSQARAAGRKLDDQELVGSVIGALVDGVGQGVAKASREHREAGQRGELVLAHVEKRHADARPEMRPLPWKGDRQVQDLFVSLDQVHRLMGENNPKLLSPGREQAAMLKSLRGGPAGDTPLGRYVVLRFLEPGLGRDEAMAGLQKELAQSDSLFAAHQLVLELVSGSSNREQALAMLDVSRKSLGDPPELLPYGVRLNRRAGNVDAARLYASRCAGSGDDRLKQVCQKEL